MSRRCTGLGEAVTRPFSLSLMSMMHSSLEAEEERAAASAGRTEASAARTGAEVRDKTMARATDMLGSLVGRDLILFSSYM